MRDRAIGIAGALLIVGGLVVTLEITQAPTGGEDVAAPGPPALLGEDRWVSDEACTGIALTWAAAMDGLQAFVGEHWEPIAGPVPGRGVFALFAYTCAATVLDGLAHAPVAGAVAVVPVVAPEDGRGLSPADGWAAIPEQVLPAGTALGEAFARHGFARLDGSVTVDLTQTPFATLATFSIVTDAGSIDATARFAGPPSDTSSEFALVAANATTFGVMTGEETFSEQGGGSALATSNGDTWMTRLGLEPAPLFAALDRSHGWDFRLWSEPWAPAAPRGRA